MSFRFLSAKSDKPKKPKKQKKQKKQKNQPKSYLELLPHGFVFFLFFLFFLVLCFFWFLFFSLLFVMQKIFVCWSNVCQRVEFLHLPKVCLDWHAFYVHFAHARAPLFCKKMGDMGTSNFHVMCHFFSLVTPMTLTEVWNLLDPSTGSSGALTCNLEMQWPRKSCVAEVPKDYPNFGVWWGDSCQNKIRFLGLAYVGWVESF